MSTGSRMDTAGCIPDWDQLVPCYLPCLALACLITGPSLYRESSSETDFWNRALSNQPPDLSVFVGLQQTQQATSVLN